MGQWAGPGLPAAVAGRLLPTPGHISGLLLTVLDREYTGFQERRCQSTLWMQFYMKTKCTNVESLSPLASIDTGLSVHVDRHEKEAMVRLVKEVGFGHCPSDIRTGLAPRVLRQQLLALILSGQKRIPCYRVHVRVVWFSV